MAETKVKAPPVLLPVHRELELKTQIYWKISSAYNCRPGVKGVQVGQALEKTCDIACTTGPHRPLVQRVLALESEIINPPKKPRGKQCKTSKQTASILTLSTKS